MPGATMLGGSSQSGLLTNGQLLPSGQLATNASSAAAGAAVLPVQSLGGTAAAVVLTPNVYTDQELAMIVNG